MNDQPKNPKKKLDYDAIYAAIGKRDCSKGELLDWIFNHVGINPTKIPLDDWPCAGAPRLLQQARLDYAKFLDLWAKTIPTQTQLKLQERAKEDGRALPLLAALEEELAQRTEGQKHPEPKDMHEMP